MSLGQLPLLTRGTFALLYGGKNIIDQLSVLSPGDHLYDTHCNALGRQKVQGLQR